MTETELQVNLAINALSRAAACSEIEDGWDGHSPVILWHQVRGLCNEHGVDYDRTVKAARAVAPILMGASA